MKKLYPVFIFLFLGILQLHAQNWQELIKLTPTVRDTIGRFGRQVSMSGNYAIVGALDRYDINNGNPMEGAGSAYIFERDSMGQWNLAQKIVASDRDEWDGFGWSVSISGNYAIVGAPYEDHDLSGMNPLRSSGSVYIFERDLSGHWNQIQKITAPERDLEDFFGCSVSISGNQAVVGAYLDDGNNNSSSGVGCAYIIKRNSTGRWSIMQKLMASDGNGGDKFGWSVSISGQYIIIGARDCGSYDNQGNFHWGTGAAYIFEQDYTGHWNEVQKISPPTWDQNRGDSFGGSVSISGNYAIVGARFDNNDITPGNEVNNAGSAYIIERDRLGNWSIVQKIVAPNRSEDDLFGNSVSISDNYAIAGCPFDDKDSTGINPLNNAGAAYIFERNDYGEWNLLQKVVASDRAIGDTFGNAVSISDNAIIIGAPFKDADMNNGNIISDAGSAYIFENEAMGIFNNIYELQTKVYPNPTSGEFTIDLGKIYSNITISISDLSGKNLYERFLQQTQIIHISIGNLPAGVYLLSVQSDNKVGSIKLLKR